MDLYERVAPNFILKEFLSSYTAERLGIKNVPNEGQLANIRLVANKIAQPVRDKFGRTTINSGFRSTALNQAIGGAKTSQHMKGEAIDFECPEHSNQAVALWISQNLEFDQLILEHYVPGDPQSGWVHASYREGANRKQILRITAAGKTLSGLQ